MLPKSKCAQRKALLRSSALITQDFCPGVTALSVPNSISMSRMAFCPGPLQIATSPEQSMSQTDHETLENGMRPTSNPSE